MSEKITQLQSEVEVGEGSVRALSEQFEKETLSKFNRMSVEIQNL